MMATITATRSEQITLNVTNQELGWAIRQVAWERCGKPDDGGCDWYTDGDCTIIGGENGWMASSDPVVARLVDAANILISGHPLETTPLSEAYGLAFVTRQAS